MDIATYKKAENVKKNMDNLSTLRKMIDDGNDIIICCGKLKLNITEDLNIKCRDIMTDYINDAADECLEQLSNSFEAL